MQWEVVDDKLRNEANEVDEMANALLQGRTVHVTGITNSDLSSWYSRFRTRHQRLLRRKLKGQDPSEGYIVWLAAPETQ